MHKYTQSTVQKYKKHPKYCSKAKDAIKHYYIKHYVHSFIKKKKGC